MPYILLIFKVKGWRKNSLQKKIVLKTVGVQSKTTDKICILNLKSLRNSRLMLQTNY